MNWADFDAAWSLRDPQFLWLGLLLPTALLIRLMWRPAAKAFAPYAFVPHLPRSLRQRTRVLPLLLQGSAFLLLVVAMARPQQRQRSPVVDEGIDLLLCIDLSSSMAATDLDPARPTATRLDFARSSASSFIAARPHDRIGLVAFARDARLICPPTLDHRSLLTLLDDLEQVPADHEDDATGIGTALARCAVILRQATSPSKVVVLLTDGEETVAIGAATAAIRPLEAAILCRDWGVRVHAIATGQDAAKLHGTLSDLSTITGGSAFAAGDAAALEQVYAAIDRLERTRFRRLPWRQVDRFLVLLCAGVALWLAAAWMRRRWWEVAA